MNVNYCLRRARRFHGNRTAVHHEDQVLTYEDFYHRVDASARRMAALGIRKGDRVAVLMANSPAYLNLYFSIPLLGALIVPMNFRWHINEMAFTLNDAEAEYLFIDQVFAPLAPKLLEMAPGLKHILYYAPGDCPAGMTDFRTSSEDREMKRPEISAEALRGGWMHTGDMGSFDEEVSSTSWIARRT